MAPLNRAPNAQGDTFRTREDDTDSYIPVLVNDSDPDFDSLRVVNVGEALHGTATISGPGTIYYLPDPNFTGVDTFTYTISDGELTSTATITVAVEAVNDAPRFGLSRDSIAVNEDAGPQTISGLATSISAGPGDEVNQKLSFTLTTDSNQLFAAAPTIDPSSGTLAFTAMPNAYGTAVVSVGLHDDGGTANGGVDSASPQTFSIVINPVNDAPSFALNKDRVAIDEDAGSLRFPGWATEIAAGPANESAQALRFEVEVDNGGIFSEAPAIDAQTGDLTFVTLPNKNGQSTTTVVLIDEGGARSEPRTFTIVVNPINDAPGFSLQKDRLEVNEDAGQQVVPGWATNIHAGAPNEASQTLRFEATADNGALFSTPPAIDVGSGDLTFAAKPDGYGESSVAVALIDEGGARSEVRTFRIVVAPINDAPKFTLPAGSIEINANEGAKRFSNWATSISAGAANESEQALAFKLTVELTNGTERLFEQKPAIDATSGELTFTTLENAGGSATVTVRLVETASGGLASEPKTFTIVANSISGASIDINKDGQTVGGEGAPSP